MKVDAKALFEVVRQVVQDEMRKVLPGLVRQHLSESYMKKLVQESRGTPTTSTKRRQPTMAEMLQTPKDEALEEIPEPLENNDEGIYAQGTLGNKSESVKQNLFPKNHPLSFVFENVQIPGDENEVVAPPSIPIDRAGIDFGVMNKLVEGMEKRSTKGEMSTPEMKMREIEARRKALEVKVG